MNAILRLLVVVFLGCAAWPGVSVAEDTDLFMSAPPDTNPANPNVLIVLDNSANWGATLAGGTKFDAEMFALNTVLGGLNDQFNVGLMLLGETGAAAQQYAYIRYAVRTMDATNRPKLQSVMMGPQGLGRTTDNGNNAPYGKSLFEAFKYFGGGTGSPQDATHYGKTAFGGSGPNKRDYAGNPNNTITQSLPGNAFISATSDQYVSPVADGCAKNYIIYLSNGLPQGGADGGNPNANTLLTNVGGNTATIPLSNNTAQGNLGDEYARFLYGADVSSLTGQQNIITYTIFPHDPSSVSGNDRANIVLLQSMANQGRGKYFAAADADSLIDALNAIFREIQSVNEVFASVSLPVSVNVRGTSLNQVYMGVFRPDQNSLPKWFGNLKEYQLILSGGTVYLGDATGIRADNPTSGFITNNATSYWTASTPPPEFWSFSPRGNPPSASDRPDGPLVEKGAAAQRLRTDFGTSQSARRLYTCTTCTGANPAESLSATPFNTTTIDPSSTSNQTDFGATDAGYSNSFTGASAQAGEVTDIINWVRGADNINDENLSGTYTDIRASIHGDVVHAKPAVINYNRSGTCTAADQDDVMVYYGANDGVFHALKGGKNATDGAEKWGFVPPEFYGKLKRLRDNLPSIAVFNHPPLNTSNNKSYFADGSVSIYQVDANNDCRYTTGGSGDKVHIFLSMRRGGRFLYALDVTDPDDPRLLWKFSNTTAGFAELGDTWSIPAVSILNLNGTRTPVLVFGGGYDPDVEDVRPVQISAFNGASAATLTHSSGAVQTRAMGRRIFIVNAADGSQVWSAHGDLVTSPAASGVPDVLVAGMNYAMPSDAAVIDTNLDRVDDRFYIGDTAGNVWRGDIGDPVPANWTVKQLAAIDGSNTARRKFLYAPVVVAAQEQNGTPFHAVLVGSGDREHPFNTSVTHRFYMFKDSYTGLVSSQTSPIVESDLFDATNALPTGTNKGWYITLAQGEKVVSNAAVLNGVTLFNTSIPPASPAAGVCTSGLGRAYLYAVGYLDGAGALYADNDPQITNDDRRTEYAGGGFAPPPTPAVVEFDTDDDGDADEQRELIISGPTVTEIPGAALGDRIRTYWYEEFE